MTRKELLDQKLPKEVVLQRVQGGREVDYVGGWTVIENANRIFGYQGWSFQLEVLTQVECTDIVHKKTKEPGWRIAYIATGSIEVGREEEVDKFSTTLFRDVGFGNGTSYNSIGDAVESAVKEAATDCMKRCLRFMGNQFGLALYDKQQRNVDKTVQVQMRTYASKLTGAQVDATANAIKTYCASLKVPNIDSLTFEQCNELFSMIKQLNEGGANEYKDSKKK